MTRLPQMTSDELVSFFERQGFRKDRQTGSHLTLLHPDGRRVTVPIHRGKDLGRGLALDLLRRAGYSVEDYLRLR